MTVSYWSRISQARSSRRRALALAGSTALGAAFLAACGGGGEEGDGAADRSSIITKHEDSTRQAKRGGILKDRMTADAATMDPRGARPAWLCTPCTAWVRS